MDLVSIIGMALLAIVSIMFLVFVILSAKTWHWLHVIACLMAYSMAVTAAIMMALTSKQVNAWKKVAAENEAKVKKVEEDLRLEKLGKEDSLEYSDNPLEGLDQTSQIGLRNMLEKEVFGRGRVWRECQPINLNDWSAVQVSTVPASAVDPAEYPDNRIAEGTVLYVFSEKAYEDASDPGRFIDPETNAPFKVPDAYLGVFRVSATAPNQVTLVNVRRSPDPLEGDEYGEARNRTWVLYEQMPIDRPDVFDDLMPMFYSDNVKSARNLTAQQLLERRQRIEQFFTGDSDLPYAPGTAEFEAFIDQYAFNDCTFQQIDEVIALQQDRINTYPEGFGASPDETWTLIKFTKDGEREVSVSEDVMEGRATGDNIPLTGMEQTAFDTQGRARVRSLQTGPATSKYVAGDELVVPSIIAEEGYQRFIPGSEPIEEPPLINRDNPDAGVAEAVANVYRRRLTDYDFYFHETMLQLNLLAGELERVARDIATIQKSRDDALAQQRDWETLYARLTSDNENFQSDINTAQAYGEKLSRDLTQKMERFNRLYGAIVQLARQKAELQEVLIDHINRQSAAALDQ